MLEAKLNREQVIKAYTANAPIYDIWAMLTESRARRQAIEFAQVRDGESILEVAVGTGQCFYELVRQNPSGINRGVDLTPAMVERSKKRIAQLPGDHSITQANAASLPFADDSFDLLVNNYMFDLMPEEGFVEQLLEFKRVLKPQGRLVMSNMARPRHGHHALYETVYKLSPSLMGGCRGVELAPALAEAGFSVQAHRYLSQMGFPSEVVLATVGA
ncbi:MAG: methyltransferase domain-containing protein [Gammaproteobacteria bacterium]|nr:methyltransferase domain-containing protein [Gammaproteobacteria bacterium]